MWYICDYTIHTIECSFRNWWHHVGSILWMICSNWFSKALICLQYPIEDLFPLVSKVLICVCIIHCLNTTPESIIVDNANMEPDGAKHSWLIVEYEFTFVMWDLLLGFIRTKETEIIPNSKVYGTNMGPIWVLSAPNGPHVGPMNFAIWDHLQKYGLVNGADILN